MNCTERKATPVSFPLNFYRERKSKSLTTRVKTNQMSLQHLWLGTWLPSECAPLFPGAGLGCLSYCQGRHREAQGCLLRRTLTLRSRGAPPIPAGKITQQVAMPDSCPEPGRQARRMGLKADEPFLPVLCWHARNTLSPLSRGGNGDPKRFDGLPRCQ